jgi:GNAT superfamily N-acetyltransferase
MLKHLAQMYKHGCCTDLTVLVGERRFEVHGCVMMCCSKFMRTQLQNGVGNGTSSMRELTLVNMSARTFELIVECMYTGVLGSIDTVNAVLQLLEASMQLQVGVAKAQCCKWLDERLDGSNAIVVWESARRLGCEALKAKAWASVGRHLQEVSRQESFLALSQPLLVELLSDDSLATLNEVLVYEAVMGWVRWDESGRKGAIGEVLGAVRLWLLPAQFVADNIATDLLIEPSGDALLKVLTSGATMAGLAARDRFRCRNRNRQKIGNFDHYRIEWSMRTEGSDYENDGQDFKRCRVTGQLIFLHNECSDFDASVVGSISVTQYRMAYIDNSGADAFYIFDETEYGSRLYTAIVREAREDWEREDMEGDLQVIEELVLDPAHRGHGLGLFLIEAADCVINGHSSTQIIQPFPLQFQCRSTSYGLNVGFSEPPGDAGSTERKNAFEAARAKISAYYSRLGFRAEGETAYMLRWSGSKNPSLEEALSALSAGAAAAGTMSVKFQATQLQEHGATGSLRFQVITAMAHYQAKSVEELRYDVCLFPQHSPY